MGHGSSQIAESAQINKHMVLNKEYLLDQFQVAADFTGRLET